LLSLFLFVGAAPDPSPYETEYVVTAEIDAAGWQTHALKNGDDVFRQRLSFANLAVADVALTEANNGEEFIPSGEQYFRAATDGPELWCTANMKMPSNGFARDVIGRVYSQYCILDANKDGVFDSFFKRARTIPVFPNVRGKITPNPRPIRPLRLTRVDPATLRTNYYVGVSFLRASGKDKAYPQFIMFASSDSGRFPLTGWARGTAESKQLLNVEDAVIEVTVASDGFAAKVVRPFMTGPQRIRGTNCGLINGC
jgi:hypothetical protein